MWNTCSCYEVWIILFWPSKMYLLNFKYILIDSFSSASVLTALASVMHKHKIITHVSRHKLVCHAAQETQGVQQVSVYFTGVKKRLFYCICTLTVHWTEANELFCDITWPPISRIHQALPEICTVKFLSLSFLLFLFTTLWKKGSSWNMEHY